MASPDPERLADDIKAALANFTSSAEELFKPYLRAILAQTPPPIFHYTRDEALRGILSTGTLRLTDAFQLNDPTELTHGLNILDELFERAANDARPELGIFGNHLRQFVLAGGVQKTAHYFVASFSLRGDDLPQWRSYADDGHGFALEFDAGRLEQAFAQPQGGAWNTATFPVSYKESEISLLYKELIALVQPLVSLPRTRSMTQEEVGTYFFDLEMRFTLEALHRNMFFKHPAYESELEYRFLQIHQAFAGESVATKTRLRGEETIRFRELNWLAETPESLVAVIIGPASVGLPGPRMRAREWLDGAGLQHVPIHDSKLPYRAFD